MVKMNKVQAILPQPSQNIPGTEIEIISAKSANLEGQEVNELPVDVCIADWDLIAKGLPATRATSESRSPTNIVDCRASVRGTSDCSLRMSWLYLAFAQCSHAH